VISGVTILNEAMNHIVTISFGAIKMRLLSKLKNLAKTVNDYILEPDTLLDVLCDDLASEFSCVVAIFPCLLLLGTYIQLVSSIPA
jgi:hypothetical protein